MNRALKKKIESRMPRRHHDKDEYYHKWIIQDAVRYNRRLGLNSIIIQASEDRFGLPADASFLVTR